MPSNYIYLLASLPMLLAGDKPPFSFEELTEKCKGLIPEEDLESVSAIPPILEDPSSDTKQPILKKWIEFDTALRNEFVKIRASRKKFDASKYIRRDGYTDPSISRIAITAYRNPSILEGEKFLDAERWKFLDELAFGHYFDLDALIVYAIKLLILIKQERIEKSDKTKLLEEAMA